MVKRATLQVKDILLFVMKKKSILNYGNHPVLASIKVSSHSDRSLSVMNHLLRFECQKTISIHKYIVNPRSIVQQTFIRNATHNV